MNELLETTIRPVAIITGASTEIGSAVVKNLLDSAYCVVAHVYKNIGTLEELLSLYPSTLHVIRHDLGDITSAQKFIESIREKYHRIDVLINTIGPMLHKPLTDITPSEWEEQIHFNLNLAFYLSHYAKDYLSKSRGQIVNFAFAGAELLMARVDSTAYCAAKAGLVVLTKSLAASLAGIGVRVNAVSPGLIEACPSHDKERQKMTQEIPLGRPGTPSEVAAVLQWLLLRSPCYVTGALIPVSGAWEYI